MPSALSGRWGRKGAPRVPSMGLSPPIHTEADLVRIKAGLCSFPLAVELEHDLPVLVQGLHGHALRMPGARPTVVGVVCSTEGDTRMQAGAVGVSHILRAAAPFKVARPVISLEPVDVIDLSVTLRVGQERLSYQ